MADSAYTINKKPLPRWIRAIKWRDLAKRILEQQKALTRFVYMPVFLIYTIIDNHSAYRIFWTKPQNPEELELIKRNWINTPFQRNWDIGMYRQNKPPYYDMWERRRKYPEHYGNRYEGYKRYESNEPFFHKNKPSYLS